ncbi:MAG TPA: nitrilase-related carbon-nitrogen hydrolase [Polyangiales bacterium]|nr:nitrilase-related carbon-nitrogen hydrolase [Polyangiales bacterium]
MTEQAQRLTLGVAQFAMHDGADCAPKNIARAVEHVRAAHALGAQVVLLPELFSGPYFPREMDKKFFSLAHPLAEDPAVRALSELARELKVVLPVSFFERDGERYFNSLVTLDADGKSLGVYRKTHIPDGTGYEEKFYFAPGDTGFKVWSTRYGKLGVGICWDQWFPECARAMTLLGADVLLYPTAIGSEPVTARDTAAPWRRAMVGHAVSNTIHVAAANRVGSEGGQLFYGTSFIADPWGEILGELSRSEQGVLVQTLDLDAARKDRDWMGLLKDRVPAAYGELIKPR